MLGPDSVDLLGLSIQPLALEKLVLANVVSDKTLYRSDGNVVRLLITDPLAAGSIASVNVQLNNSLLSQHKVKLDGNGAGFLILADLPVGDCQVSTANNPAARCEFVVAEYRLVPLVAKPAGNMIKEGKELRVEFTVESFGVPFDGELKVDVMDGNTRISSLTVTAHEGLVQTKIPLQSSGSLSLALQSISDPAKTASLPLRGTRKEEREQTIFSRLGIEVFGSLIAEGNTEEVRGIHLGLGGMRSTPLSLEKVQAKVARLRANVDIEQLKVVVVDPARPTTSKKRHRSGFTAASCIDRP